MEQEKRNRHTRTTPTPRRRQRNGDDPNRTPTTRPKVKCFECNMKNNKITKGELKQW